ncbi:hypothetical protein OY671_006839, partial [Metschnikowia pulcherrima]
VVKLRYVALASRVSLSALDVPDVASFRSCEVAILDAGIDATLDVRSGAISEVDADAFAVELDTVSVSDDDYVTDMSESVENPVESENPELTDELSSRVLEPLVALDSVDELWEVDPVLELARESSLEKVLELDSVLELDKVLELDSVLELGKSLELDSVLELGKSLELDSVLELARESSLEKVLELDKSLELGKSLELDKVLESVRELVKPEKLDVASDPEIVDRLEGADESIITEGLCAEDESEIFVVEELESVMVEDLTESLSVLEVDVDVVEAREVVVTSGKVQTHEQIEETSFGAEPS